MSTENKRWEKLHNQATVIDLHAHASLKISLLNRMLTSRFHAGRSFDPFGFRTDYNKLKKGGLDILLSTLYAPEAGILKECPPLKMLRFILPCKYRRVFKRTYFEVTCDMLDTMEDTVKKAIDSETGNPLAQMVLSVTELEELLKKENPPVGVIHSIEGAHSLSGKLDNLDYFFNRGVAYLIIAHFDPNEAVNPCFPYPESVQKFCCFREDRNVSLGLTDFGEQLVEKMIDLGVIIDITHCTPPARRRIYDIVGTRAPIIASHVGAYEINPSPYNLRDEEIKRIADTGGVVGVIFMNYWLMPHETKRGLNFISRTIEHIVNLTNADFAAIGTDFDGFTDPPDDLKDASQMPKLTQRLIADGLNDEQIRKILGENILRVLRQGWGKIN